MDSFYLKIEQVLKLEIEKRFTNCAVSGGLRNLQTYFTAQNIEDRISVKEFENLLDYFKNYNQFSARNRKLSIEILLKLLESEDTDPFTQLYAKLPTLRVANNGSENNNHQDPALYAGLQAINGIGPRNAKYFGKLEIFTIYDLLRFFPRKYQDFSQLKTIDQIKYGEEVTLTGLVMGDIRSRRAKNRKLSISEAVLSDSTGTLQLTWFNQPFLKNQLKAGMAIVVSGKIDQFRGRFTMNSPAWERLDKEQIHTNRIVPIYPGTSGLSQRQIRKIIKKNIDFWATKLKEYLPEELLLKNDFSNIASSLNQIHFPDSTTSLHRVQKRFAFEEVFFLQLGTRLIKENKRVHKSNSFKYDNDKLNQRKAKLPYTLTASQHRAIEKILNDLSSNHPMNRLLQGDVGSGKTVVAKFAVEAIINRNAQSAILTPTSILAEQHFETFRNLLFESGAASKNEIALLLGKTSARERKRTLENLINGKIKCLIGTHALLQDDVVFNDLQLVIIDEQHRFGVNQRNTLINKGSIPHTLVMSATPIPRSLAITIYGDMDITIIDEMPAGRIPVTTKILQKKKRSEAYKMIEHEIEKGHQAFIVYPMIEDSDENQEKSVIANYERLQKTIFLKYRLGILHGKMKNDEKDHIMQKFRDGEYDILVSTTVIEVGVDIPGATIILIESADCFGLAQLHQMRGRVGRNNQQSLCVLIPDNDEAIANKRLQAMVDTNDGFKLADIDLAIRGPGEFLGTRQSGYVGFEFANLTDTKLIERCHQFVNKIINIDAKLESPGHALLREELSNRWPGVINKLEKDDIKNG